MVSSSMGGLGLRRASSHSYASLYNSVPLVSDLLGFAPDLHLPLDSSRHLLANHAAKPNWQTHDDINVPCTQHTLSRCIDEALYSQLLVQSPSKALALSSSLPHAGDWLAVVPSRQLGLHFLDHEFRLCSVTKNIFRSKLGPPLLNLVHVFSPRV